MKLIGSANERHQRFSAYKESGDLKARDGLRAEIAAEIERSYPILRDIRLFTARVLVGRGPKLSELRLLLRPLKPGQEDELEAGLRPMIFESLGQLLTDDKPFLASAESDVRAIYAHIPLEEASAIVEGVIAAKGSRDVGVTDLPMPVSVKRTAAELLLEMSGETWGEGDPIGTAIKVWKERRAEKAESSSD